MPNSKGFHQRLEVLDRCLRTQGRKWTLEELLRAVNTVLAEQLGSWTSKRTMQNDLKYLRDQKSAPLAVIRQGRSNYFYYNEPFSLQALPVDAEEISYLRDAIQLLQQVNDFSLVSEVEAIILKLENTVHTNVPNQAVYIQFEKLHSATGKAFIDPLFVAIRQKLCLRITYQSFQEAKPKMHLYHPYLLKEYRNRYFLFCREGSASRITTLALDRIQEIKNSSEPFLENDLFDPRSYFDHIIGVSIPPQEIIHFIEVKVSSSQAPYILSKPLHSSQEVLKTYKSGAVLLGLRLMENFELMTLLLSFGSQIEIKKPLHLRQLIRRQLLIAARAYR